MASKWSAKRSMRAAPLTRAMASDSATRASSCTRLATLTGTSPTFGRVPHCTPAVQGRVVLLHTKRDGRGEVEEVYMYGADSRMPRSKTKLQ